MLNRRGFSLIEMVAAVGISAVMAAVLVPAIIRRVSESETGVLIANLTGLADAVSAYRGDVGRYPRQLTYLTTQILAGTQDLCSVNVPNVNLWEGPYAERSLASPGVAVAGSLISDTLTRFPTSNVYVNTPASLIFTVKEIDESRALEVDSELDGDGSLTAGPVQWAGTAGRGSLTYRIPIRGC